MGGGMGSPGGFFGSAAGFANRLGNFNPYGGDLGGIAQGRLGDLLQTGLPTDVSGITEAAKTQAQREFEDFTSSTNEEFGALGLGPSSARQRAISRGAAEASTRIGEAGLRAQVAAQEAAANRSLGAFSPFFMGTGQQLSGLQGGLQGFLGLAGLGQQGSQFQQQQLMDALKFQALLNQSGGFQRGGEIPRREGLQFGGGLGGRRVDPFDFLSNITYGTTFTRPQPFKVPKKKSSTQGGAPAGGGNQNGIIQALIAALATRQAQAPQVPIMMSPPIPEHEDLSFFKLDQQQKLAELIAALQESKQDQPIEKNMGGPIPMGMGEVPGPSVPPDKVPALLQGGELIVPVDMRAEIERSSSDMPIIQKLKTLLAVPADTTAREGGKVEKVMHEFKHGTLHSGSPSGPVVQNRDQAIAIAMSEAQKRKSGGSVNKYQAGGPIPLSNDIFTATGSPIAAALQSLIKQPSLASGLLPIGGDVYSNIGKPLTDIYAAASESSGNQEMEDEIASFLLQQLGLSTFPEETALPEPPQGPQVNMPAGPAAPPPQASGQQPAGPPGKSTVMGPGMPPPSKSQGMVGPPKPERPANPYGGQGEIFMSGGRESAPLEDAFTAAQNHANALRDLALKTPSKAAAIHRMAAEAQQEADTLAAGMDAFKQQMQQAELAAAADIQKARTATLPAQIQSQTTIKRGREADASRERIAEDRNRRLSQQMILNLAIKYATTELGTLDPKKFQEGMVKFGQFDPEQLQLISSFIKGDNPEGLLAESGILPDIPNQPLGVDPFGGE